MKAGVAEQKEQGLIYQIVAEVKERREGRSEEQLEKQFLPKKSFSSSSFSL